MSPIPTSTRSELLGQAKLGHVHSLGTLLEQYRNYLYLVAQLFRKIPLSRSGQNKTAMDKRSSPSHYLEQKHCLEKLPKE